MKRSSLGTFSASTFAFAFALPFASLSLTAGCGGEKKPAESPEGATEEGAGASSGETPATPPTPATPKVSSDPAENDGPASATACVGLEMELIDALSKAACEVPNP